MEEFEEMARAEDQSVDEEPAHVNSVDNPEFNYHLRNGLLHEAGFEDLTAFARALQANIFSQHKKNKQMVGYVSSYDHSVSESIMKQFEIPGSSFISNEKLLDLLN